MVTGTVAISIYHIDRTIRETGESFGDESHIIYVNSQIKDDMALGKLMHDFSCTSAKDMYYWGNQSDRNGGHLIGYGGLISVSVAQ